MMTNAANQPAMNKIAVWNRGKDLKTDKSSMEIFWDFRRGQVFGALQPLPERYVIPDVSVKLNETCQDEASVRTQPNEKGDCQ